MPATTARREPFHRRDRSAAPSPGMSRLAAPARGQRGARRSARASASTRSAIKRARRRASRTLEPMARSLLLPDPASDPHPRSRRLQGPPHLAAPRADDGRPVHLLRPDGAGDAAARRPASTCGRIPHINLATVTYLFAGAIDHRDSLGTFATIEPGAVNLMTAGRGITHSERSPGRACGPTAPS